MVPVNNQIADKFGRKISSLRLSVTDRCNFRCSYCMPQTDVQWFPHGEILTYEEMVSLVRIFVKLGITKVKVTGGEPLMRRDLPELVRQIAEIDEINDISLTTNGYFLDKYARELFDAGLMRVTVSLDSLREARFNKLVGRELFTGIYNNLLALQEISFKRIKVNAVIIRGFNDDEICDFIRFARTTGYIVRFIEFMPLDGSKQWSADKVVPLEEMIGIIEREFEIEQTGETSSDNPALSYRLRDGSAEFGFIASVSSPFCGQCGRIRLTADGHLRTCLFSDREVDLKSIIRSDENETDKLSRLEDTIRTALIDKEEGHLINLGKFIPPDRPMNQIGG